MLAAGLLAACDGRPSDRAATPRATTLAPDLRDDPPSARFAHPLPFEAAAASPRAGSAIDAVPRLEAEVARLRSDVAQLREEVRSAASAAHDTSRVPPALADPTRLAAAEAAFRGEPVDPDWSQAMADAVRATVAEVDRDGAAPRAVECRSRSCRIELAADDGPRTGADLVPVLQRFAQTLPRATAGTVSAADGREVMVVYLSR